MKKSKTVVIALLGTVAIACLGWAIVRDSATLAFKFPKLDHPAPGEWFEFSVKVSNFSLTKSRVVGIDHC